MLVPLPTVDNLAAIELGSFKLNTVISTSLTFTYPADGNAVSKFLL